MQRPNEGDALPHLREGSRSLELSAGAGAVGVESVGEKYADAKECHYRRDDPGHGHALIATMPLRVVLMKRR